MSGDGLYDVAVMYSTDSSNRLDGETPALRQCRFNSRRFAAGQMAWGEWVAAHLTEAVASGVMRLRTALAVQEAVQALVSLRHCGIRHHAAQGREAPLSISIWAL